jgi:lysophospholipase L1-like esterase
VIRRRAVLLLALLALGLPAVAAAQVVRYIAFGDSITEGTGDDPTRIPAGYPPRLEALLRGAGLNALVENHGVSGEATPEGLLRLSGALFGTQPGDSFLLMEGTNDISRGLSIESTRFNLNEMGRRAEDRGLKVVHATVVPRLPTARADPQNYQTLVLNQNVRDIAGRRNRELADPFEVFLLRPDRNSTLYSTADRLGHPNAAGYDLIAQTFFDVLTDVDKVPPVTGLMTPAHGAERVPATAAIEVDVWDFGAGVDVANTDLLVNGADVAVTPTVDGQRVLFSYQPPQPLRGVVKVGLRSRDLATPANTVDRDVARFVIVGTTFFKGDLDEDGRVDGNDLVQFAVLFGAREGQTRYVAIGDLNNDNAIDGQDLAILASNFGKSSF